MMGKLQISKDALEHLRKKIIGNVVNSISDFVNVRVWHDETQCIGECLLDVNIPFITGCVNVEITFMGIPVVQFHAKI